MKNRNFYLPLDSLDIIEKYSGTPLATVENVIVDEPRVPSKKMMYFEENPSFLNTEMPMPVGSKVISFYIKNRWSRAHGYATYFE